MPTLSQMQTWLSEAHIARHQLRTGGMPVSVGLDGNMVTYTRAEASDLDAYITTLESQIAGATTGAARRRTFRVTQSGTGY